MGKNGVLRIKEIKLRMVFGEFQIRVIKSANRSDIAPVAFKVISKNTLTNSNQMRDDVTTKVIPESSRFA